jgi:hypothetical protein
MECHGGLALRLSDNRGTAGSGAHMNRHPALQVGHVKSRGAVAAVSRTDDVEQRRVIRDVHRLAVAERPVLRRELKSEAADFTNIRL